MVTHVASFLGGPNLWETSGQSRTQRWQSRTMTLPWPSACPCSHWQHRKQRYHRIAGRGAAVSRIDDGKPFLEGQDGQPVPGCGTDGKPWGKMIRAFQVQLTASSEPQDSWLILNRLYRLYFLALHLDSQCTTRRDPWQPQKSMDLRLMHGQRL